MSENAAENVQEKKYRVFHADGEILSIPVATGKKIIEINQRTGYREVTNERIYVKPIFKIPPEVGSLISLPVNDDVFYYKTVDTPKFQTQPDSIFLERITPNEVEKATDSGVSTISAKNFLTKDSLKALGIGSI